MDLTESVVGKGLNLKVGEEWSEIEITSEPYVVMTFRGFSPVVDVLCQGDQNSKQKKILFISAKSFSTKVAPLVMANQEKFTGLKLRIRKDGSGKMAPYKDVEVLGA